MKKTFELFVLLLIVISISFLQTQIIISIAGMYDIPFIEKLTFMQIFGFIFILKIIKNNKIELNKTEVTFSEKITDILNICGAYLLVWGIAYLIQLIIF